MEEEKKVVEGQAESTTEQPAPAPLNTELTFEQIIDIKR